ncbi:hypothetical protein HUG15_08195 [Salicibibacter cibarius]|uniref:Uncharacterized protein n=1 Tax=Salicibibacter cibarius TaxID=2743000 RepID=A0A7T6Z257_9BACI|nr:hypothetical protein [Salicibibacter cibarius]QQK75564.1 hypothetical protein HUG15_08195 [Salicibibacter cibarius]
MKVKILNAVSAGGLEKKINQFIIENEQVEIKNIQITAGYQNTVALIVYEE